MIKLLRSLLSTNMFCKHQYVTEMSDLGRVATQKCLYCKKEKKRHVFKAAIRNSSSD